MEKGSCSHAHVKLNMLWWSNSSSHAQYPFLYGISRGTLTSPSDIRECDWMNIKLSRSDLVCTLQVMSTHSMQQSGHSSNAGMNKHTGRHNTTLRKRTSVGLITGFSSGKRVTKDPWLCFNSTGQQATYSCNLSPGQHELGLRQHTLLDGGRETRVLWLRLVEVKQRKGLRWVFL